MKKILLLSIFFGLSFSAMQSQQIMYGAKAGLNLSTIGGDKTEINHTTKTGFHLGVLAEIPITGDFAVQPEVLVVEESYYTNVLFTSQGAKMQQTLFLDVELEGSKKLEYIQVPVMAKYYVVKGLALEAGPQVSFLTRAIGDIETTSNGITESRKVELTGVSKIDFSVGAGASLYLDMGVFFAARYNFGLTNINDSDASDWKALNNVFQLSAGYFF